MTTTLRQALSEISSSTVTSQSAFLRSIKVIKTIPHCKETGVKNDNQT